MRAYGSLFQPITIIIVAVLFAFAPNRVKAANLTVCASGCQYTTIQSAINAAATGDTIRVSPGTYSGATINKQIILESEDYNRLDPKLNPITINSSLTIQGSWAWDQGPTIRGFALRSTDAIIGNAPFTAEYNYVSGGSDGISFEPGSGGIVRGNYVENTGDDCIDVDHQTKNILIENNKLINCGQDGIEIRQQDDSIPSRITLMFRNNYVDGSGEDGIQIMDYNNFSNRSYMVERNAFIRSGKAGIGLMAGDVTNQNYSAPAMPEPLYAVNNTFVDNDAGISGGANLIAINNIFQGQKTFDLKNVNGNSKIFNSLFAVSAKQQGTNNLDTTTTKTGSPLLDGNYQLQSGSPAIDAGRANYQHTYTGPSGSVTDTVLNLTTSNYSGSAPDLGWIESTGSTTPTVTGATTPTTTITAPPSCANKLKGDADCIPDGVGKQTTIVDFQIWRNEFFAGCSSTNLTATSCQTDEDHDGSLMDANFDSDTSVSIADFEIWRKGYFEL